MVFKKTGELKKKALGRQKTPRGLQSVIRLRIEYFLIIGAVILVVVYGFSQFYINLSMYHNSRSELTKIVGQSIQWRLAEADGMIRYLVEGCNLNDGRISDRLHAVYRMNSYYETILILDSRGQLVHSEPPGLSLSDYSALTRGGAASPLLFSQISGSSIHRETGKVTINFSQRTKKGNYVIGQLNLSFLQEIVRNSLKDFDTSRLLMVTDQFGNILAHPDEKMVQEQSNIGIRKFQDEAGNEAGRKSGFFEIFGKTYFVVSMVVPETGWILMDATRMFPLFTELSQSVLSIVVLFLLFILLWGLYAGKLIDRVVVSPLDSFVEVVRRSSRNNTLVSVEKQLSRYREFLQLQGAFNNLAHKIKVRERELQKFQRAVQASGFSIYITDEVGKIEYVNPAFERITGYRAEEIIGKVPEQWSSKEFRDTVLLGKKWEGEIINERKGDEPYYGYQTITPILDHEGKVTNFVVIQSDLTDRKRMENELRVAKEEAESANRAKSNFIANVSHEIRTPMNAILGYNQLLAEADCDAEMQGYIESIGKAGNVLLNLINDILDISRIESGYLELDYGEIDLRVLINDIGQIFKATMEGKGIHYIEEISKDLPVRVVLDEGRIRQLLLNLIGNAVKFTDQGYVKLVVKSLQSKGRENRVDLSFEVEDTGIGIKKDQQQKVFEAFQQQEGQNSRKFGGTGLGLAITKQLVEAMDGKISLRSREGEGSSFRVVLRNVEVKEAARNGDISETSGTGRATTETARQLEMYTVHDYIHNEPQMLEKIRDDFYPRWEELKHTMFIDELQGFAESLEELGRVHGAFYLVRYARELLHAAEQLDISELEVLIRKFPRILENSGYPYATEPQK